MRYFILLLFTVHIWAGVARTQTYDGLSLIKSNSLQVYSSKGQEAGATIQATRMEKAMNYYGQLFDFKPEVILLVLTEADWPAYTSFPVYGMPHYNNDKTLIVTDQDNSFWKSFIPPAENLPAELKIKLQAAYGQGENSLSMKPFFDLLALHELGHAFHFQAGLNMQRKWMGELFVNILLHTYVAENEPGQLPALTLFPRMVIGAGTAGYSYTSLSDVHERYEEIGMKHPKNYGWYQSRWHAAAAAIYDAGGKEVCRRLWEALRGQKEQLNDEELPAFFERKGLKVIAELIRNWDRDTVK